MLHEVAPRAPVGLYVRWCTSPTA